VELAIVAVASLTAGCIWRVNRRYGDVRSTDRQARYCYHISRVPLE
jgi:hypothetical protein